MDTTELFDMSMGVENGGMSGRDIKRGGLTEGEINTCNLLRLRTFTLATGAESNNEVDGTEAEGMGEEDTIEKSEIGAINSSSFLCKAAYSVAKAFHRRLCSHARQFLQLRELEAGS